MIRIFTTFLVIGWLVMVGQECYCATVVRSFVSKEEAERIPKESLEEFGRLTALWRALASYFPVRPLEMTFSAKEEIKADISRFRPFYSDEKFRILLLPDKSVCIEVTVTLRPKYEEYRSVYKFNGDEAEVIAFIMSADVSWSFASENSIEVGDSKLSPDEVLLELFSGWSDVNTFRTCDRFVAIGTASWNGSERDEERRSAQRARNLAAAVRKKVGTLRDERGDQLDQLVKCVSLGKYRATPEDKPEQRRVIIIAIKDVTGKPKIQDIVKDTLGKKRNPEWLRPESFSAGEKLEPCDDANQ